MNMGGVNREGKWLWLSLEATILLSLLVTLYEIIICDVFNVFFHRSWNMAHSVLTINSLG